MVHRPKNFSNNFQMGEMPVENIVYSRSGGCFISIAQGIFFLALITILGIFLSVVIHYSTKKATKENYLETLENYISEEITENQAPNLSLSQYLVPTHYILAIQPRLNETDDPFTYSGSVYITFTPNIDHVQLIELQRNDLHALSKDSIKVIRVEKIFENENIHKIRKKSEESESESFWKTESVLTSTTETSNDILIESTTSHDSEFESTTHSSDSDGFKSAKDIFALYFSKFEHTNSEILIKKIKITDDTATINLGLSLRKNSTYVIKVDFIGNMTTRDSGFLISRYFDENGKRSFLATTITNSDKSKPIFPTLSYNRHQKTPFDVFILRRPQMISLTNSKLLQQVTYQINSDDWILDIYQKTMPMRVFDFGVVLTQITPTLIIHDNITIYVYIRQQKLPNLIMTYDALEKIIGVFVNVTGIQYHTERINLIAIPTTFENTYDISMAMIVGSETFLINHADSDDSVHMADVILYLAKLWILPIAKYENEHDLWLNDALPVYLQWMTLNEMYEWNSKYIDQMNWMKKMKALQTEVDLKSLKIDSTAKYLTRKLDEYSTDAVRGFFLLKTFENILGRDNFTDAIKLHCTKRIENEESNLMEYFQRTIFEMSIDKNVVQIANSWIKTDLYPLLNVQLDKERNELSIAQEQFLSKVNNEQHTYSIPVRFLSESQNNDDVSFVTSSTVIFPISQIIGNDSWLLLNPAGTGYYRINYDVENWKAIICSLKNNYEIFDDITRATLADDAFTLARYGYLNYSIVFELVNCWKGNETEYLPWKTVLYHLEDIQKHSSDLFVYKSLKSFMIDLIKPSYDRIGDLESVQVKELIRTLACNLDINGCTFGTFAKISEKTVSEGCIIVKYADPSDYRGIQLLPKFVDIDITQRLLRSLSCSRDIDFLTDLFDLIYDVSFEIFIPDIIRSSAKSRIGKKIILEILYEDFPRVVNHTGIENLLSVFEEITTEFELKMLEDIFTKYANHFPFNYKRAIKYVVNKVKANFEWRKILSSDLERIDWKQMSEGF